MPEFRESSLRTHETARPSGRRRRGFVLLVAAAAVAAVTPFIAASSHAEKLDLSSYTLTFSEEFDSLDVSPWGPGTRWIAHTPWAGDFGDAAFTDPAPNFPFSTKDGVLRIEARKGSDGKWRSGLLASFDPTGGGFSQQYGYFEARAKLPAGPGLWPAFWLATNVPRDSKEPSVEVDVLEHYGKFPGAWESVTHVWYKDEAKNRGERQVHEVRPGTLSDDFHTYGVSVDSEWIVIYFDREEKWRTRTPAEHKFPLGVMLNLAMGAGWPIDETPNPSYMYVDYVRVYASRK